MINNRDKASDRAVLILLKAFTENDVRVKAFTAREIEAQTWDVTTDQPDPASDKMRTRTWFPDCPL